MQIRVDFSCNGQLKMVDVYASDPVGGRICYQASRPAV